MHTQVVKDLFHNIKQIVDCVLFVYSLNVGHNIALHVGCIVTELTVKGSFSGVHSHVRLELPVTFKVFAAHLTLEPTARVKMPCPPAGRGR